MKIRQFGALSGPFIPPARGGIERSFVMILHGWGADGNDIASIALPISVRLPGAAFFAPNGPNLCKMNPCGREWFDIDDKINGPVKAAPIINDAIAAALDELSLPSTAMSLAGFSQGGMMSLHCGLRHKTPLAAIISFSGMLLLDEDLVEKDQGVSYPPVLLVHGTEDEVVPFSSQSDSRNRLKQRLIMVETFECNGLGHGIDPDGLTAAIDFLAKYLPV